MRVLAFVSEMPGSGKTVLAGHVAAQAAAEGIGPVVLFDGDPAKGAAGGSEGGSAGGSERGLTAWWRPTPKHLRMGAARPNPLQSGSQG